MLRGSPRWIHQFSRPCIEAVSGHHHLWLAEMLRLPLLLHGGDLRLHIGSEHVRRGGRRTLTISQPLGARRPPMRHRYRRGAPGDRPAPAHRPRRFGRAHADMRPRYMKAASPTSATRPTIIARVSRSTIACNSGWRWSSSSPRRAKRGAQQARWRRRPHPREHIGMQPVRWNRTGILTAVGAR